MPTQQNSSRLNALPLRNLNNRLRRKKRTSRTPERTIRRNMNPLLLTQIDDFLLWEGRVIFELVYGGDDGCVGEELGEIADGVVGYTDGFGFTG